MTTPTADVSVIICAYSAARWLALCQAVQSVRAQRHPAREIIVVVDHNPALLACVRSYLPDVVAIENRECPGLSGTRNTGVGVATGAVVAFLDDDAVACPDWLTRLSAAYDGPDVVGVGGAIMPVWSGARPRWFPEEFDWVVGCTYRGLPENSSTVRNLIGCNMSFRRRVLQELGGFRPGIGRIGARPLGCEETELCIRALQQPDRRVLLYEPQARVLHKVPGSRQTWRYFRSRCYAEGLSKAAVTRLVGVAHGLSSERSYVRSTLPRGIVRGLAATVRSGDPSGFGRAAAILTGLVITAAGYLTGTAAGFVRLLSTPGADDPPTGGRAPDGILAQQTSGPCAAESGS